jgi:PAP2 superfamily
LFLRTKNPFIFLMRTYIHFLIICVFTLVCTFSACKKEQVSKFQDLTALTPTQQDAAAATWKPVVLTAPDEIALPAPTSTQSAEYQAELAETKQIMANLTEAQKDAITYWSGGSVLRWNQIMRNLVTKYNLPPAPGLDDKYPVPNADSTNLNPFYYPYFPFANPPYAARAYAYVSVAQFDGLIASWHYRNKYNRKAPYQVDASIQLLVPINNLPTYPCEEAVIAAAAQDMLSLLFPGDKIEIARLANEAAHYRQWAGAAVKSDIDAGLALGKSVAAKTIARAKTDNMKTAGGNNAIWDSLAQNAVNQGNTPWLSQDSPVRPPMLPLFGRVKPWLFQNADLATIRPAAPFAATSTEFANQLAEVKREADPNDREKMRIVHFWADGAGTATPPGHWNSVAFEEIYAAQYSEVRTARAFALLNMAQMDAAIACWETKYHYFFPRPSQMDPSIKTLTGLPNFPAYTSGHSTFSAASARILGHLFPAKALSYQDMAKEASISRLYGGIHYRMDCDAGLVAGQKVGDYAVERARADGGE